MSMEFTLNDLQRQRVEDHLALVEQVLRRSIKTNETVDGMGHDDLYQEGCIALCRAAVSYREEMGAFPAYARTVIRNYLLDRCREIQSARKNLPLLSLDAFAEMGAQEPVSPFHTEDLISDVSSDALLSHFKNRYHGTARLGIEAMELRVRGYGEPGGTCADCVLNQFGSDGNNKGKACKNMRMLYLLRSGEYMPIQIALPPTSLTPYTRFVNEAFLSRRRKVCTGVVRIGLKKAVSGSHEYCVATFTKIADFAGEDLAHIRAYADGFVAQIKDINAQRAQAGAAASSIIGDGDASHLELPDNGAHFALGAVIDGEREELPA